MADSFKELTTPQPLSAEEAQETPEKPNFMSLAVEIRLKIYEMLATASRKIMIDEDGSVKYDAPNDADSLLFVNGAVSEEYKAELFHRGTFIFVFYLQDEHEGTKVSYLQAAARIDTFLQNSSVLPHARNIEVNVYSEELGDQADVLIECVKQMKHVQHLTIYTYEEETFPIKYSIMRCMMGDELVAMALKQLSKLHRFSNMNLLYFGGPELTMYEDIFTKDTGTGNWSGKHQLGQKYRLEYPDNKAEDDDMVERVVKMLNSGAHEGVE